MTDALTYSPDRVRLVAERAATDFGMFCYDGFGVLLSDEQLAAHARLGNPGPRFSGERKFNYVSGGQRAGKTVLLGLWHCNAALYKRGVDTTSRAFWRNYLYKTLAVAPSTDLSLKLWTVMDELSKGASDAQFDRKVRRARGGYFLHKMKAGKAGQWPIVRFENGAVTDFRSTEGWATRLEGDQWWFVSWDEWASQPDREIAFVLEDVLMGRSRDHDAKIVPAAWPKQATERHLMAAIRRIEGGDRDSQVIYLDASKAYFTNFDALKVEKRKKSHSQWLRTVQGQPAGGAAVEFKTDLIDNMVHDDLPLQALKEDGYRYLSSWDLGLAHDATIGLTWRIPLIGVTPYSRARLVNATEIRASEGLTLDSIAFSIAREQQLYGSQTAVDATGLGGVAAFRQLGDLKPPPLKFVARSNDRLWGNMRLAAITNGLDMLSWERPDDDGDVPWGLVESPRDTRLLDQLANFDRDAKNVPDDWVWAFLIGLWYIRRYWVTVVSNAHRQRPWDVRRRTLPPEPEPVVRRATISMRRSG